MSLTIGDLVGHIRADDTGMRQGLAGAEDRMRGFQRDVNGRLRDINGRFVSLGEQAAAGFGRAEQGAGGFQLGLGRLVGAAGGLGGVAMSIGTIAAQVGAAVPLVAGLGATLAQVAPAAGVAVTGLLAVKLATTALKLGMVGVEDAVSAALDPSKAAEFEQAIAKLSPNARSFAREVKTLAPAFKKLQQDVQDKLFSGFDKTLRDMGKSTLPVVRKGLLEAGGALNSMGKGVGAAAITLSKNGTLGKAIGGATAGLKNLSRVPGQLVTGLTQVAAAAAPSFDRLTKAAGKAFDRFSKQFTQSFESGAMEKSIEKAITVIGDLAEIAGNVFQVIGSIFSAAQASGGGFIGVLKEITGALADAFASPEIQGGLKAIFKTMAVVATTVAPLLVDMLKIIGPVFEALGPPIQEAVKALGAGLKPVIDALGPVLVSLAKAFGSLIRAVAPLLTVGGELVAALLPALIPLFEALRQIFEAAAPFVRQLAETLGAVLTPILAALTPLVEALTVPFVQLAQDLFPLLTEILVELTPSLVELSTAFADLVVALAPVLLMLFKFTTMCAGDVLPVVAEVAAFLAGGLSGALQGIAILLNTVVIPAIKILASVMRGDFGEAARRMRELGDNLRQKLGEIWTQIKAKALEKLGQMRRDISVKGAEMRNDFVAKMSELRQRAGQKIGELPGAIRSALGNLGSTLYNSGRSLVQGFIDGLRSMLSSVRNAASSLMSAARDYFPFSPAKEGPFAGKGWTLYSGQSMGEAVAAGLASRTGAVGAAATTLMGAAEQAFAGLSAPPFRMPGGQLAGMPQALPGMTSGRAGAAPVGGVTTVRIELAGPEEVKRFIRKIVQTDGRGSVQTAFGQ
ncbi:phage tail protein [Streptomyces flavidovirens]|uniref:phage tail protein n=1 Tax=Streptomyces flavidovirens TaxID=67298 RepID=UPI00041ADDF2|nr:hypothetical protein [Streptomyces flavidovirens]